jgi:hypothetical protein
MSFDDLLLVPLAKSPFFHQRDTETPHRGISGNPGPVNAPTNHDQIELFTFQSVEAAFAIT